jgi:hypothetical protein
MDDLVGWECAVAKSGQSEFLCRRTKAAKVNNDMANDAAQTDFV